MDYGMKTQAIEKCSRNIMEALELARRLVILADEGEIAAMDDSCVVLYGIIRDSAYKIRHQAEQERERHIAKGAWKEPRKI